MRADAPLIFDEPHNIRRATIGVLLPVISTTGGVLASSAAGSSGSVVLGSAEFAKPDGEGWGSAQPARVYNGGDPGGLVTEIRWTSWGSSTAIGYGLNWIFKPGGGYYSRPVIVELRAQGLGHCESRPAYTQLAIRGPSKPEGQLGAWHLWSEAKSLCRFGF
jgi:hypothetical protein